MVSLNFRRIVVLAAVCTVGTVIHANTYVVTTTADSGGGSLRQAINSANSNPGADRIEFNILPAGEQTITPVFSLPSSSGPLVIDGSTQPGFSGTPLIHIDGVNCEDGLQFNETDSALFHVRLTNFEYISVSATADNMRIKGCFVDTDSLGNNMVVTTPSQVFLGYNLDNVEVGGSGTNEGNVIAGGISMFGVTSGTVQGNYLGVRRDGTAPFICYDLLGLNLQNCSGVTVGGTTPGAGNVIGGYAMLTNLNGTAVVMNNCSDIIVQGNCIGTGPGGTVPMPNTNFGILLSQTANSLIGGTEPGAGNIIANNGRNGVFVSGNSSVAGIAVLGNSIYNNGKRSIALGGTLSIPANDNLDADTGINGLQNYPVLAQAEEYLGVTRVKGTLHSTPNSAFRVEFFASDIAVVDGSGEGKTYLGFADVTTDASGNAEFSQTIPDQWLGSYITATATDSLNNTSHFSQTVQVVVGESAATDWELLQ